MLIRAISGDILRTFTPVTFLVNIIGSFVMGLLVSGYEQGTWLMMATVGLCGARMGSIVGQKLK